MSNEVIKESYYEIQTKFEDAELAAQSDKPSELATINVLGIKFEKSRIKPNKEQNESEKNKGTESSARWGN